MIFKIFSNIDVLRSIIVVNFLEYVYCIIRISILLLRHCYVPKIQFYLMIFSLVKKISTFFHFNCVLQLNISHACVEAMKSMNLSKV